MAANQVGRAYNPVPRHANEAMVKAADGLQHWQDILKAVLATWLDFLQADHAFTRAYMIEFWAAAMRHANDGSTGATEPPGFSNASTDKPAKRTPPSSPFLTS